MSTMPPESQQPHNPEPRDPVPPAQQQRYPGQPSPGGHFPPPNDPLVPANFSGWLERVFGAVRRSFAQLAVLQAIVTAVSVVFGVMTALLTPDFSDLRSQLESGTPLTQDQVSALNGVGSTLGVIAVLSLVGVLVTLVLSAYVISASAFVVIRDAAGQPTTAGEGLRLGAGRALPLLGWGLLAGILMAIGFVFLILPGLYFMIIFVSLVGVVVVERAGIGRCFALTNSRLLATAGRILLTAAAGLVYFAIVFAITGGSSPSGSVIGAIARPILLLPVGVVGAAVNIVTYAELRFHERGANTGTLLAELTR